MRFGHINLVTLGATYYCRSGSRSAANTRELGATSLTGVIINCACLTANIMSIAIISLLLPFTHFISAAR